ncbi:hypothetical protein ACFWMU_34500 [Streptomyces sp. NPDC058357]|uniref:hypothetical protein n=1 Tax=unclassified Streptomyces TaxID=2593676 RepID=UPI00364D0FE3
MRSCQVHGRAAQSLYGIGEVLAGGGGQVFQPCAGVAFGGPRASSPVNAPWAVPRVV